MALIPINRRTGGVNWHPHTYRLTVTGHVTVDDRHYAYLNQFTWFWTGKYASRSEGDTTIMLHHEVWKLEGHPPPTALVDHRDRNTRNNQAGNLREATHSQSQANKGAYKNSTSGHPGVCWDKRAGKWKAQISVNRVRLHLGYFANPAEAAKAYDAARLTYFGDYA